MKQLRNTKNAVPSVERRFLSSDVTLRGGDSGKQQITGWAIKYGPLSQDLGGFKERVSSTAFDASLRRGDDVVAAFNHSYDMPLARLSAGNLTLDSSPVGLRYSIDPSETSYAADLIQNLKAGIVKHSSFAFIVDDGGEEWQMDADGQVIRTITSATLMDVSPVTFPAYLSSTSEISVRAMPPEIRARLMQNNEPAESVDDESRLDTLRVRKLFALRKA